MFNFVLLKLIREPHWYHEKGTGDHDVEMSTCTLKISPIFSPTAGHKLRIIQAVGQVK